MQVKIISVVQRLAEHLPFEVLVQNERGKKITIYSSHSVEEGDANMEFDISPREEKEEKAGSSMLYFRADGLLFQGVTIASFSSLAAEGFIWYFTKNSLVWKFFH